MKSVVFFFLLLLQISCLAQSIGQQGNWKHLKIENDPDLPETGLKNSTVFISLLDSVYFHDWDTISNSWINTVRNTYKYNKFGLAIDKHVDFFDTDPYKITPYSQEIRSYYPNGRLKEQENRLWSSTLLKYFGVTRQQYDFDGRGNIIDFSISYLNELSEEWYVGYRVRQFFDVRNNLTEYYEYKSQNPGDEPELIRKQNSYYNKDNSMLKFMDSVKNPEKGTLYCKELQQYQYDLLGRETDFVISYWSEDANRLTPVQRISTKYNTVTESEITYQSYDKVNNVWLKKNKTLRIVDNSGRPVDEKYFYFYESDSSWNPTTWTTTVYENENDFAEKISYEWNQELGAYLPTTRIEKLYIGQKAIREFNYYTYENGWICKEKIVYEYDSIGNLTIIESMTRNASDSIFTKRSKWINYYTFTDADPIPEEPTNGIKVFPNPANSLVFVYNVPVNSTLRIFDSKGLSVYEKQVVSPDNVIDISGFSDGIYSISLANRNTMQSATFIKIKQ